MVTDLLKVFEDYYPQQLSSGEIKMQCPFRHLHASDSQNRKQMFISQDKNMYHCFSCGSKGTLVGILTTQFEFSLSDAIELVNLEGTFEEFSDYEQLDIFDFSLPEWEPDHLLSYKETPEDLLDRGFSRSLIRSHGIGVNVVEHKKFGTVKATTYPQMQHGKLVGCKYRTVYKGRRVFWYNEDFKKSHVLYNIDNFDSGKAVLVEGETDVLQSERNGCLNVCASLGVELSEFQVEQLVNFETVYIGYDNDTAGMMGKEKAYYKLKDHTNVLFIPYPADDPGSCSRDGWLQGIINSDDYVVYSMEMFRIMGDEYADIQLKAAQQLRKSGFLL